MGANAAKPKIREFFHVYTVLHVIHFYTVLYIVAFYTVLYNFIQFCILYILIQFYTVLHFIQFYTVLYSFACSYIYTVLYMFTLNTHMPFYGELIYKKIGFKKMFNTSSPEGGLASTPEPDGTRSSPFKTTNNTFKGSTITIPFQGSANPFGEIPSRKRKIAFRPTLDEEVNSFFLEVMFDQTESGRPDAFDVTDLVNLGSILVVKDTFKRESSIYPQSDKLRPAKKRPLFDSPPPSSSSESSTKTKTSPVLQEKKKEKIINPNIILLNIQGKEKQQGDFDKWYEKIKIEDNDLVVDTDSIFYVRINESKDKSNSSIYTILDEKIKTLQTQGDILCRIGADGPNNFTKCIDTLRGLYVSKTKAAENIVEPFYVILEGIQWRVHNIDRLCKRTLAEIRMLESEISRRSGKPFQIRSCLDPNPSETNKDELIAAIAHCLEARLTYTWYKHDISTTKHLLASRVSELEGVTFALLQLLEKQSR